MTESERGTAPSTCNTAASERTETLRKTLICHVCGGTEIRSQHCKIFCLKCGYLIENCSGD